LLNPSTTLICFELEIIKEIEQNNRSVSYFCSVLERFFFEHKHALCRTRF